MKLTREDQLRLKEKARKGNYDAIVALVDLRLAESLGNLVETHSDHRYYQGKVHALKQLLDDIVSSKAKN